MRRIAVLVTTLSIVAAACGDTASDLADGSLHWRNPEYLADLPADPRAAYPEHARLAVLQEHGPGTFLDGYDDGQILELARLWCADGSSRFSRVIGDEVRLRGANLNPSGEFMPPLPIGVALTRVADLHQPQLCDALT